MDTTEHTASPPTDGAPALEVALEYHRAWTRGEGFDPALVHVADDIVCDTPGGRIEGVAAFREFMGPFAASLSGATLLACYGDDSHAMVMYDAHTALVSSAPGAEWVTVRDGRIVHLRIIFDRLPFAEARAAQATQG